ncbi:MAG: hypothetical protein Q7R70_05775 [Candidatus Diapherotrites archaeon]|nr:hypothetical protein [Candidatus Diapherotrites archaeon]
MLIKRLEKEDKGSYCTFHAQSTRDAITRLKKLGVLEIDLLALDLIIVQRRWTSMLESSRIEKRRITEIAEVLEKEGKPVLNVLFEFNFSKDCLERKNKSQRILDKFLKTAGRPDEEELFSKALSERTQLIERLSKKGMGFEEFFKALNRQA